MAQRELAPKIEKIALRALANNNGLLGYTGGAEARGETFTQHTVAAPQKETEAILSDSPIIPGTLDLIRPDGYTYKPYVDYTPTAQGFTSHTIPEGQLLTADYVAQDINALPHAILDEDVKTPPRPNLSFQGEAVRIYYDETTTYVVVEPTKISPPPTYTSPSLLNSWTNVGSAYPPASYYLDRDRVYLRGRITGGTKTSGTILFTVPSTHRPSYEETPMVMTNAGPTVLTIKTNGDIAIGTSPFEAGNTWLSLDAVSWRVKSLYGPRFPGIGRYPGLGRYPNGS